MLIKFYESLGENFRKVYLPQHILMFIGLYMFAVSGASLNWLWLIYPAWFLFGHIGFGIIIHKYYCHNSFETYPWIARLGAYLGLLCGTGSPVMLKVVHIGYHHPNSDTDLDPHTPKHGFWWSYFGWLNHKWDFRKMWLAKDIMRDPYIRFYHRYYYKIYWGTFIVLCLLNWKLALFTMTTATVLQFHLSGLANTLGHTKHWGSYQNYTDGDNSQNSPIFNFFTLGLGLHNNHHGRPGFYDYAHKPGEIDIARWFVPLIAKRKKEQK